MWTEPGQGRWVCPRCFADNEADADRCASCGLERGADPAAAAAAQPGSTPAEPGAAPTTPWAAAPQPQSQRPGWLQLVLRFWWVGLLVIGGGIAAANWLGGVRPLTDVAVGECFDLENPDEIDDVTKRDCTDPHEYEMLLIGELPDGPFPSEADTDVWFDVNCRPAFADYVGLDYDTSELYMLYIVPTEETWNAGDHGANCAIYDENNPELTESVKDSAR